MVLTEGGKKVTDGLTEEGFIVLGSTILENGHIFLGDLLGSISATSNVTGALRVSRKITGSTSAISALSGTLSRARPLAGAMTSSASVSGSILKSIALAGAINAVSDPRVHVMRRRTSVYSPQIRLFDISPAFLSLTWSLKGAISATSSLSGTLSVNWSLKGSVPATTSLSATSSVTWSLKGGIAAASSVSGSIIEKTYLAGSIAASASISGSLTSITFMAGTISATSSLQGTLSHVAPERGFYYAKLGGTILDSIEKDSFRITEELNKIPSFEFEIANCSDNRTTIAAGITDVLRIYRRINDVDVLMFTGIINADTIEYLSLERIRLTGYASYIDLNWRFHKHLNSEDAETVDKVYNYTGSYSDKTTEANNDTINDVPITWGSVNDALYIGQGETFFGMQVKYSTKGVQAANTIVIFEYSKGSGVWATLDVLDETRAFTEDVGTYFITIPHKPSDWAKDTVNSVKKFWIRARLSAGSYTTSPALDRIKLTNTDVYRVYYFETAANSIMTDVLEGTGYSMDATDVCPSDAISIVAEYETKLRFIAGVANALTWDDSGDKKAYQWWVDTSKKVHFKQKRGATLGDITSELTILNNVKDYFNLSNRLHFFGNYDGRFQLRSIIENIDSQDAHEIREHAVFDERHNNYTPLKEAAEKAMTYTKAPLQKIAATVTTKYWLDQAFEVGNTVTLHKDTWNVDSTAFQIVRADIGPRVTKVDMGISQEHLDGLKAGLQRQLDITGIRMHGSTTLLQFGPETMNYQRVDDSTVYPAKLKIEIPSDVRYIHRVLLSWTIGPYRADVDGGGETVGHDHGGAGGEGGAFTPDMLGGGGHTPTELEEGGHTPTELSKAHTHSGTDGGVGYSYSTREGWLATSKAVVAENVHTHTNPTTCSQNRGHTHTNPTTAGSPHYHDFDQFSGPSGSATAITEIYSGSVCDSGHCFTGWGGLSFASGSHTHSGDTDYESVIGHTHTQGSTGGISQSHTHTQGATGAGSSHTHNITTDQTTTRPYMIDPLTITLSLWETDVEDPAHIHTINPVVDHIHTINPIIDHDHAGVAESAHSDHVIVAEAAADINLTFGIHEEAAGTTLELLVNSEVVASNYEGNQTDIRVDGYLSTGNNTVEIRPIVGENGKKGSCTTLATGIFFIEAKK